MDLLEKYQPKAIKQALVEMELADGDEFKRFGLLKFLGSLDHETIQQVSDHLAEKCEHFDQGKVIVLIDGGVGEVIQQPDSVEVEIIDLDNEPERRDEVIAINERNK